MTAARHRARVSALQVLYLWELGRVTPAQALGTYFREHDAGLDEAGRAFVERVVTGTVAEIAELDRRIAAESRRWRLDRIAAIDRLILRMAAWELRHEPETPAAVVIDEAVELARAFGSDDSTRFVNGVLDAVRRTLEQEGHVERS